VTRPSRRTILRGSAALLLAVALAGPAARGVRSLRMTRRAMATYTALLAAANAQDLDAARALCSRRFVATHRLAASAGGGIAGLPRNIHRNFQVWREGDEVWLCPTDRVGPVYRFAAEAGSWKFDGPVGLLRPGGRVERAEEASAGEIP